jgi:hypothetical protein
LAVVVAVLVVFHRTITVKVAVLAVQPFGLVRYLLQLVIVLL